MQTTLIPRRVLLTVVAFTPAANNGGKMEQSRLRACTGMRYALLNPIFEELTKGGRIRISAGRQGDLVSLIDR